jgi:hypothetical protein
VTADEPRTHWAGVVIPDLDMWTGEPDWRRDRPLLTKDAPVEPHAPASGDETHPVEWWNSGDGTWAWRCFREDCPLRRDAPAGTFSGHLSEDHARAAAQKHAREPHMPGSGPDSTPRGSQEAGTADGHTEALARAMESGWREGAPFTGKGPRVGSIDWDAFAAYLWPLVVAYGDERAAQALRDAAGFCRTREDGARERRGDYNDGLANAYDAAADELETRADEMGPRP